MASVLHNIDSGLPAADTGDFEHVLRGRSRCVAALLGRQFGGSASQFVGIAPCPMAAPAQQQLLLRLVRPCLAAAARVEDMATQEEKIANLRFFVQGSHTAGSGDPC